MCQQFKWENIKHFTIKLCSWSFIVSCITFSSWLHSFCDSSSSSSLKDESVWQLFSMEVPLGNTLWSYTVQHWGTFSNQLINLFCKLRGVSGIPRLTGMGEKEACSNWNWVLTWSHCHYRKRFKAAYKLKHEATYKYTSSSLVLITDPAALNKPELQMLGRAISLSWQSPPTIYYLPQWHNSCCQCTSGKPNKSR